MYLVQLDTRSPLERKAECGKVDEQEDIPYDDQAGMDIILGNLQRSNRVSASEMVFSLFKAAYCLASDYLRRKYGD